MTTPEEWAEKIPSRFDRRGFATAEQLTLLESALAEHPGCALLWCLRGNLIQLSDDENDRYSLQDALASYQRAIELEPQNPVPYIEIGHYHDAALDDPGSAEPYFRKAVLLGGGDQAREGLEDVLDQLNITE